MVCAELEDAELINMIDTFVPGGKIRLPKNKTTANQKPKHTNKQTPTNEKQPKTKQWNKINKKSHKKPTTPNLGVQVIDYNFENWENIHSQLESG